MTRGVKVDAETAAELKRLRELEKQYKVLKEEHELLKNHPQHYLSGASPY